MTGRTERDGKETSPRNVLRHIVIVPEDRSVWTAAQAPKTAATIIRILEAAKELGIEAITIRMPQTPEHIPYLSVNDVIKRIQKELQEENFRFQPLGAPGNASFTLGETIPKTQELTRQNTGPMLVLPINYSGRSDIVKATRRLINDGVGADDVTEDLFSTYLSTNKLPDPDLIINTGSETFKRSGFMIWEDAYAEYSTTPTKFNDLSKEDMKRLIDVFPVRNRKFGGLSAEPAAE